jgi:hypothetical protein
MRCIINVIIGNKTPKQRSYAAKQQRLRVSLEKHFNGTFLNWTTFPNDNYDKQNPYNAKAAAFEEAIRQGYTQILWVDAPVVALQDVTPIFDRIEKDGYIAIKNNSWNCAQTVNDACLEYFKVSRDDAEKIQEIATGVIGIDVKHPNGKKLIETFIQACKDGAAAGSRIHDNQSQDPRFKFHRQEQSVFSLSAHKHDLPYTLMWNSGPIALIPSKVHGGTILSWSSRENRGLNERNFTRKKEHESYIYLLGYGGISDILSEFVTCTKYAVKHKRSLLFEMGNVYTSTDINSVFDFSNYPVPVYTDKHMIQELLKGRNVEPPVDLKKYSLKGNICFIGDKPVKRHTPNSAPLIFDTEKEYPRDTILIRSGGRKGRPGHELYFFEHVTLQQNIIEQYKEFIKKHNIPSTYIAAHLRATDKPLSFEFNISGINKPTSNAIKHEGVDAFIEKYVPMQAYIATDNKGLLNQLKKKHPSILHSDAVYKSKRSNNNTRRNGLHRNGRENPQVFIDAIIELIVLAKAKILMPSVGGYTEMARALWSHKDVVERLLA